MPLGPCTSSSAGPSRSPGPSAAGGRPPTRPPRLPPIGDPGDCPPRADKCARGRPPFPPSWTRRQQPTWRRGPHSPSRTRAPATPRGDVGLCGRHLGNSPGGDVPSRDGPHNGGVATGHGLGRARGQVMLHGARGARRPGGTAPGRSNPAGIHLPPTRGGCRHWGLQDNGASVVPALGGRPERPPPPPLSFHL